MVQTSHPQTCLVTGGAGFIGSHLVEGLLAQGVRVRVLDNLTTGKLSNVHNFLDRVEFIHGDIRDMDVVCQASRGVDVIVHHAALASVEQCTREPLDAHEINVTGTLHVLESARRNEVSQVVFASSAAVYGPSDSAPLAETTPINPVTPYGVGKAIGEDYCKLYSSLYGLTTVVFRYFNVFGPRQCVNSQYSGVISAFLHAVTHGQNPILYGDGEQSRDFVYVTDIRDINVQAVLNPNQESGVYNIGTGQEYPVRLILEWLQNQAGYSFNVDQRPERRKDPRHSISDIQKASLKLGFTPKVQFFEGLEKLLATQVPSARGLASGHFSSGSYLRYFDDL